MSEQTLPEGVYAHTPEGRVAVSLARMEAKMDVILSNHSARLDSVEAATIDHEERIRFLEKAPVVRPSHLFAAAGILLPLIAIIETWLIAAFWGRS